jgi:DNA adenine methylase
MKDGLLGPEAGGAVCARPFVKWAGGKGRLAPLVVERAPRPFGRYHEPFLGGGAVFFAMAAGGLATGARLSDANGELMAAYRVVRDEPAALVAALQELSADYRAREPDARAAMYYAVRASAPPDRVAAAAWLLFLNRTCYNGLYRVNARGGFNVPHGRYANPRICDADGLAAASRALQGCELAPEDFEAACAKAKPRDFVYFDPPYQPLTRTANFTSYTRGEFGPAEQERLRDAFEAMTRRGVAVLLSNSDHPVIRALYGDRGYRHEVVSMSRAINSVGSGRAPVAELLIANFDRPEVRDAFAAKRSPKRQPGAVRGAGGRRYTAAQQEFADGMD